MQTSDSNSQTKTILRIIIKPPKRQKTVQAGPYMNHATTTALLNGLTVRLTEVPS